MSDTEFRGMVSLFRLLDFFYPYVARRAKSFGIREGMTVVDYGCGPGRYTVQFARLVGEKGRVIAVDIKDLCLKEAQRRLAGEKLCNAEFKLARGYDSGVDSGVADMVFALDMFFKIKDPTTFLQELARIGKDGAVLIIDDAHQSRRKAKKKIEDSGVWSIAGETRAYFICHREGRK